MTKSNIEYGQEDNNFDIEGDINVKLAPIKGTDNRRQIDRSLFAKKPKLFLTKFVFSLSLVSMSWYIIYAEINIYFTVLAVLVCGLMYAHLIELQHECLHNHAFNSSRLNRLFGVMSGAFMLVSHSHYRYDHLRHHANLGTAENMEHFNYRFQGLNSIAGFAKAFFDLSRYKIVFSIFLKALLGKRIEGVEKSSYRKKIKQEYLIYVSIFLTSVVLSIYFGTWFFAIAWWLPSLLIAEGTHFMIEMPEHFGLNSQSEADVLSNTRTIKANKLVSWFVNGNDLHTAHHYHQGVPMCNLSKLQDYIKDKTHKKCVETSYSSFYYRVLSSKIRQERAETVMAR
jgi:fatty acid desaturase